MPSESTSAGPCDAGSKQRTGDRERKAPARDRADPANRTDKDKKRKRVCGKSNGSSSTKARAAGGAAGGAGGADGGADGPAAGDGMGVR